MELYTRQLTSYSINYVKDIGEAEDIVQDSFLKLWENQAKLIDATIKSWLYMCVRNASLNLIKKHKRKVSVSGDYIDLRSTDDSNPDNFDLKFHLNNEINKLKPLHREILLFRDRDGLSYDEIGEKLDLSGSQVKVYLFRARKVLKDTCKKLMLEINE
jgi:RNA polymerase sigma-70 factor (ECF subfamily)